MEKTKRKKVAAIATAGVMAASIGAYNIEEVSATGLNDAKNTNQTLEEAEFSYSTEMSEDKGKVKEWLDEKEEKLKDEYEITNKEIIEVENQVISTEKVDVNETFDTKEDANQRKEELENKDIENADLSIEYKEATKIDVNETFETKEAALAYIKKYKDKYSVSLSVSEIYSNWVSEGTIKVKELSGFTEEERDKEVDKIINEIQNSSNDTVRYEVSVTKTSNTEKVYIKDNVTNETKVFTSLEDANEFIKNLKLKENDNIKIEVNGPVKSEELVSSKTSKIEETFSSQEEVTTFLNKLKEEGYLLENINTEKVIVTETIKKPTGNVIVNSSSKLDSNNKYEVEANYIMIKQASGNAVIWTKKEMTKEEQKSFKEAWLKGNYDGSINKDFNFHFIFGEGEKDLSYIGNQWGTYNISVKDDKIQMTCDKGKISHLNYGTIEKEYTEEKIEKEKYNLSGDKTMNTYKDVFSVDYKIAEKIFEDQTTYGAIINKETFKRDKDYNVTGFYEENKELWILKGTYIKNNRGSLYYGLIEAKEKQNEETYNNDNPPRTGDENNLAVPATMAGLALAGVAVATRKRKRD